MSTGKEEPLGNSFPFTNLLLQAIVCLSVCPHPGTALKAAGDCYLWKL